MAERRCLRYALELAGARAIYGFFRLLPLDWASAFGGFLARSIGPRLGASKRAVINLRQAMPELGEARIAEIVRGMWDNLGRVIAEYPHLGEIDVFDPDGRVAHEGIGEALTCRDQGKPCLFFSAHYGHWEIAAIAAVQASFPTITVYRPPNNPFIDRLLAEARRPVGSTFIPKGPAAGRRLVEALESGASLLMLVDQKMNDGIPVPFFGRKAMTAPALARLALRFRCPVVPTRIERLAGAHFRITILPPLPLPDSGDLQA
ncbi:MAG: lauroyl acyltransferase, partial [Stellaceae bacterium]